MHQEKLKETRVQFLLSQVGSNNDHLANRYLTSALKDQSTMRAELTE